MAVDTNELRRLITYGTSVVDCALRDAADEIDRLRKLLKPTVWTDALRDYESFDSLEAATDDAPDGEPTELVGWAHVADVRVVRHGGTLTTTEI